MARKIKQLSTTQQYADSFFDIEEYFKKYPDSLYYIVWSGRSDGKSYSVLLYGIKHYLKTGVGFSYVRRIENEIYKSAIEESFENLTCNYYKENAIFNITNGQYNGVHCYAGLVYLCNYKEDGTKEIDTNPFMKCFCLTKAESYKSRGFSKFNAFLVFEEFISQNFTVYNEFINFKSICSTIIRNNGNTKIIMLGNVLNPINIYFDEMGLYKASEQQQGSVDQYRFNDDDGNENVITCIYPNPLNKTIKHSDKYFIFGNHKDQMTTNGKWQIPEYPHLTHLFSEKDIKFKFYVQYKNVIFEGKLIKLIDNKETQLRESKYQTNRSIVFVYFTNKTSELQYKYNDFIVSKSLNMTYLPNHFESISKITGDIGRILKECYINNRFEYQNNTIGLCIDEMI